MRWYLSETEYPAVRLAMGPDRLRLSDEQLEALLEESFPDSAPGEVENFMSSLQGFAKQAAPIVQQVAPAVAKGAMSGATVGGPWGALIGGLGGGAASLLSGGARPQGRPPAGLGAPGVPAASLAMPAPGFPPAPATAGGPAAAQLLTLLSRPETMQALLAMLMGQSGRTSIPVGGQKVPVSAFADAIAELASEAAGSPAISAYWYDPQGQPRGDLMNPRSRAALLWGDLAEAAQAEAEAWEEGLDEEMDAVDASLEGDALDSFEAALVGESLDAN